MNVSWIIDQKTSTKPLREIMSEVQRVFAALPHEASQLVSGSMFFRLRGQQEHGLSYYASLPGDRPHTLTVHMAHPDPVLFRLARRIRDHTQSLDATFESEYHTREQPWATDMIQELRSPANTEQSE